jgi:hypothetical protein
MKLGLRTVPIARRRALCLLAIGVAWPRAASAVTHLWTGAAGDAQFTTPGNWSPAGPPGPADTAHFSSGGGALTVLVTASGGETTVEVGQLLLQRPVRFVGTAAFGLWGVPDAAGDSVLVHVANVDVTFQNDLLLRAAGLVRTLSNGGLRTLDLCGAVRDDAAGLPLQLRPQAATSIRLMRAGAFGGGTVVGSPSSADAAGNIVVAHPTALGPGPVTFLNGGNLHFATPTFASPLAAGGVVNLRVEATADGAPIVHPDGSCALDLTGDQRTLLTGAIGGTGGRINLQPAPSTTPATLELGAASGFEKPVSVLANLTLRLADAGGLGATTHDTTLLNGATLELEGGIVVAEPLNLSADGQNVATWRSLGGDNVWSGPVTGSANLFVDVVEGSLIVLGSTSGFQLTKLGAATLELGGPSAQGSLATIAEGTLRVNGSLSRSTVIVAPGARLEGSGTVTVSSPGGLLVNGTLAPGDGGPGTLAVRGIVSFGDDSTFEVEIDGAAADRLAVAGAGTVALTGAALALSVGAPQPDTSFTILSGLAVGGGFDGLPEGAVVDGFSISYGADVVLHPVFPTCTPDGDSDPPALGPCPADVTAECDGPDGAGASWVDPAATDDCDAEPAVACTPASGMVFPLGATEVACVAQDQHGGASAPCTFLVSVVDTTPPAIDCPPAQTVAVSAGDPVTFTEATASDPCGVASVACAPASGDPLSIGADHTVTCTAADASGLTAACTFLLTVVSSNQPPLADAGPDQFVSYTVIPPPVTLSGAGSSDDGRPDPPGILACSWSQLSGPPVALADPSACESSFTAPLLAAGEMAVLTFELTVGDGEASSHDEVNVTVTSTNHAPVCPTIAPITVAEGASAVVLDGTASFDPDGDPIAYLWVQTSGIPVPLAGDDAPVARIDAPEVDGSEVLTFDLTVDDGLLAATCNYVVIVESQNHCPTADAGDGSTVATGDLVLLDGTGSSDPDEDPLSFSWVQTTGPAVTLLAAGTATPSFVAPAAGAAGVGLSFTLTVDDGFGCTSTGTVEIHVTGGGAPPRCDQARPSERVLWPPNHHMVPIWIRGVDAARAGTEVTIDAVTQDEPVDGCGDGHTSPDAKIRGGKVLLRAERGPGNGRVYHVHFTARSEAGSCSGAVEVCVPHARHGVSWRHFWKRGGCVDDGELFDSTVSP